MVSSLGIRPVLAVTLAAVAPYAVGVTAPPPEGSAALRAVHWARRTFELIPTPWLITAAGAVLLGTTAAFGGLADGRADGRRLEAIQCRLAALIIA